jgi:hypothetical protein
MEALRFATMAFVRQTTPASAAGKAARLQRRVRPRNVVHLIDAPDCGDLVFTQANLSKDTEDEFRFPNDIAVDVGRKAGRE